MTKCWEAPSSSTAKRWYLKHTGLVIERGSGICLCHHCDNRLCWRPDHIYEGTKSSNAMDKVRRYGGNKLNAWQVLAIRRILSGRYHSRRGRTILGECFGITEAMVRKIEDRKAWAHLG